ncbi:tail fiber domain-containing protein [Geomicrobium sp. JCM 19055]|uniref:tail fiber domain-containing protein n=1 Tax=Geomicrobium sp. JCM 19055 TaxID=1460649 RepID=UPI0005A62428|nr:tail fiber domain-containing protein [Geomicrobium sp. JCM 19055]
MDVDNPSAGTSSIQMYKTPMFNMIQLEGAGGRQGHGSGIKGRDGFIEFRDALDSSHIELRANNFREVSSVETKYDIHEFEPAVLDVILDTPTYRFKRNNQVESDQNYYFTGFIAEEMPPEIFHSGTINLSAICAFLWKGMQEQQETIEELKSELEVIKNG